MGSELLSESDEVRGGSGETESPLFISKMFEECFPYYLALGMSYDEYWNGDPSLVRAYRKAEDIRLHRRNWEYWLQGRYVYDGIMRLIPTFNPLKPKEPLGYVEEPYPLTEADREKMELEEERRRQEAIRNKMMAFMEAQKQKKKEQEDE